MSAFEQMDPQAPHAMERDELSRRRQEGGLWLREMRERAGISQRELAERVGQMYYSFVSQIEAGKGRVPIAQMELWARALGVPRSVFARGILKYYDPVTYDMLFSDEAPAEGAERREPAAVVALPQAARPGERPLLPALGSGTERSDEEAGAKGPDISEELKARISRIEAILMMRGASQ